MAIAYQAAGTKYQGTGTSSTLSIASGTSHDFAVGFAMVPIAKTMSSLAWNGTNMTQITTVNASFFKLYAYYIPTPSTGTNNLVGTASASTEIYMGAIFYSGASPTGQPDASATANGTGTTLTQTVTTVADNCWTACCTLADAGGLAASTGSTTRGSILNTAWGIFDSNAAKTPAGSTSMTQSMNSGNRAGIIVSFKPPASGGGTTYNALLYGAGL